MVKACADIFKDGATGYVKEELVSVAMWATEDLAT